MYFNYKNIGDWLPALVCLLLCAGSFSGCKKLVDAGQPLNTITTDRTFSSNALADAAMAGLYSQLMNNTGAKTFSNGGTTLYGGLLADELVNFLGTNSPEDYPFFINKLYKEQLTFQNMFWGPAYKIIYGANAVIEGVASSPSPQLYDSVRQVLTGEAKCIRALSYFYLTNLFGDVPLVTTTDFTKTVNLARTPKAEVYDQMVLDLKDAQQLLPGDYSTAKGERIRINKWAATALLARVYLYQQNWAAAETAASAVIGNNQYALEPSLSNVFLKNSNEAIWQLKQDITHLPNYATWDGVGFVPQLRISGVPEPLLSTITDSSFFVGFITTLVPQYYLNTKLVNAFEPNDKRKLVWIDSTPAPKNAPYNGVPYYFTSKYNTNNTSTATLTEYYMVLRLAEQYLIRAEARAQQDKTADAAADLNILRNRAGLPNTTASSKTALLDSIAHERQVELFAEWGHRWLDLKRTGKASSVLSALPDKQPWSDKCLLFPIPPMERTNDPNLEQNPGY